MKTRPFYLALAVAVASANSTSDAQSAETSSSWTGAPNPRVDSLFTAASSPTFPGCAVEILRNGQTLYSRGYGSANLQYGIPIKPETSYDIGSVTKQFTAMSVLILASRGALSVSDDIRKYIPELPRTAKPIRIQNLLNQTSGVRDYVFLFPIGGVPWESVVGQRDALAMLASQHGTNFEAGAEWEYSNSNYFLLSVLVERVTGKPLADFFRKEIFEPLGMRSTTVLTHHGQIIPNEADSYNPTESGFDRSIYNWETTGDGAIHTTVGDLALWDANFYAPKVGTPEIVAAMQTPGMLTDGTRTTYGDGLGISTYRGLRVVSHNGGSGGFVTEVARFPDQHFSTISVCVSRVLSPFGMYRKLADMFLSPELAAATVKPTGGPSFTEKGRWTPHSADSAFAGRYFSPQAGDFVTVRTAGDSMTVEVRGAQYRIVRDSPFYRIPGRLTVFRLRRLPGGSNELLMSPGDKGHVTRYESVENTAKLSTRQLDALTGRYRSDDINASWTVTRTADKLVLNLVGPASTPDTLHEEFRDGYSTQAGVLRFVRNPAGLVTGLLFWTQGARALPFTRASAVTH
jgi:Beta-lactamase class C and other penicillin binding proteins